MENIFFTLKPAKRINENFQAAYLVKYNIKEKKTEIIFEWHQIDLQSPKNFIETGFSGLFIDSKYFYVCSQFCIFVIDKITQKPIKTITHRLMNILHGLFVYEDNIYISSTGNDLILVFNKNDYRFIKAISLKKTNLKFSNYKKIKDYRFLHKSKTKLHNFHLNDIHIYDNSIYVTTKNNPKNNKGLFLKSDLNFSKTQILISNKLEAPHDGVLINNKFYFTQSGNGKIASYNSENQEFSEFDLNIDSKLYFVRGLCYANEKIFVGLSNNRDNPSLPAKIIILNSEKYTIEDEIILHSFYDKKTGCAIHTIFSD